MSSSVIDYFAVLGHKDGTLCYEPFRNVWSEEKNIITAAQVLDEAITDVAVISAGKYAKAELLNRHNPTTTYYTIKMVC